MKSSKGFKMEPSFKFSIIQASPDELRGETVNVGVVAETPGGVSVRFSEMRKLRALTGHGWDEIATVYEQRIVEIASANGLAGLVEMRPPVSEIFKISALGTIQAKPEDFERQLQQVLKAYVSRPKLSRAEKQDKINTELKKFFRSKEILAKPGDDMGDRKVHASFVVSQSKSIVADFALQAKNMRIAATLDFRRPVAVRAKVFEKGGTLWFAKNELGSSTELFGVYAASDESVEEHRAELAIFNDYAGGNTFNWLVAKDQQRFAQNFY